VPVANPIAAGSLTAALNLLIRMQSPRQDDKENTNNAMWQVITSLATGISAASPIPPTVYAIAEPGLEWRQVHDDSKPLGKQHRRPFFCAGFEI
jgi:hypothetical protein